MKLKLAIAGLAVFLTVGAFLYHGHVQYHKGVNDTLAKNLAAGNEALTDNAKIWNEVRHENAKITDRVAAGRDLGILRPDALR